MHDVKVKRAKLLKRIKTNRDNHRDLFLRAQKGYRQDVIEELDKMLEEAKSGKPIRRQIHFPEPQDHTADYDRVIDMLEMSIDDDIILDATSFDKYVRDQWSWTQFASTTNRMYASKVT